MMRVKVLISILCFFLLFKGYLCIRGGAPTHVRSVPYQAAIYDGTTFSCSGSLIQAQWVLTAATCVRSRYIRVILGATRIHLQEVSQHQMTIPFENIKIHPDYNSDNKQNDIALIKLPHNVTFNRNIKPIAIQNNSGVHTRSRVVLSGWGQTGPFARMSEMLMSVTVEVISNTKCYMDVTLLRSQPILPSQMCTQSALYQPGAGACPGDVGAPLVLPDYEDYKPVQIGIASVPLKSCRELHPTIYTRVFKFKSWIEAHMKGNDSQTTTAKPVQEEHNTSGCQASTDKPKQEEHTNGVQTSTDKPKQEEHTDSVQTSTDKPKQEDDKPKQEADKPSAQEERRLSELVSYSGLEETNKSIIKHTTIKKGRNNADSNHARVPKLGIDEIEFDYEEKEDD